MGRRALGIVALTLSLGAPFASSAEEADAGGRGRLSVEEAVRAALANSEELRIARREVDRAAGRIEEARSAVLPRLAATVNYQRLSGLGALVPGLSEDGLPLPSFDSLYQADLTVTQLVYQGGQVRAGLAAARVAKDQASVGFQHAATQVVYATRMAYALALVQREFLDAAAESLALARKFLDDVRSRRDAGQTTDFDVLQASVRVRNAVAEEVKARTSARVAVAELLRRIGLDQGADPELTGDLARMAEDLAAEAPVPESLAGCLAVALGARRKGVRTQGARLDLVAADLAADMLRIVESVSTAGRRPTLALQAALSGTGFQGFFDESFDSSWRAGLALTVPVFDGFAARGKQAQAMAELAQAELARDSLARDVELEVRSACWRLESAREFLASAEENVTQAREAVRQADLRYRNGLIPEIVLEEARLALAQARTNHALARFGVYGSMLDLRRASGLIEVPLCPEDGTRAPAGRQNQPAPAAAADAP